MDNREPINISVGGFPPDLHMPVAEVDAYDRKQPKSVSGGNVSVLTDWFRKRKRKLQKQARKKARK